MFSGKIKKHPTIIGWIVAILTWSQIPSAVAAPTVLFSSLGASGCVNPYGSTNNINAMKFRATSTFAGNIVRVALGTQTTANFANSSFYIMSNNPTGATNGQSSPGSTLAIFTPDTITGSGVNTLAVYVGNVTITSGTYFWMVFGNKSSVTSYCYAMYTNTSDMILNGASVDTSSSLVNTSWRRAQTSVNTSPVNATWSVSFDQNLAYQFSFESTSLPQVGVTLSGSNPATYRTISPLTATVTTPSQVTFWANQKVIPGCRNVSSLGGTAGCNWKPSNKGSVLLYASANPVSTSYSSNTSSIINIGVGARKTLR
jgi:hypothetical protein